MKFFRVVIVVLCVCVYISGCNESENKTNTIFLASWNVQNLFNAADDGNEYDEYSSSGGWKEKYYKMRLENAAEVLSYPSLSQVDILVLNEVENESVLEDLMLTGRLKKSGFYFYAMAGEEGGAIKTAVVSKIPISHAYVHSVIGARPVLQVDFDNTVIGKLSVFAVHAKSNIDGDEENVQKRISLGAVITDLYRRIKEDDEERTVIVMGDFNENPEDAHVLSDFSCWDLSWDHCEPETVNNGSYNYRGEWYRYDNIAVSSPVITGAGVVSDGILITSGGLPNAFNRRLLNGVSDHLPVWAKLENNNIFLISH